MSDTDFSDAITRRILNAKTERSLIERINGGETIDDILQEATETTTTHKKKTKKATPVDKFINISVYRNQGFDDEKADSLMAKIF